MFKHPFGIMSQNSCEQKLDSRCFHGSSRGILQALELREGTLTPLPGVRAGGGGGGGRAQPRPRPRQRVQPQPALHRHRPPPRQRGRTSHKYFYGDYQIFFVRCGL